MNEWTNNINNEIHPPVEDAPSYHTSANVKEGWQMVNLRLRDSKTNIFSAHELEIALQLCDNVMVEKFEIARPLKFD